MSKVNERRSTLAIVLIVLSHDQVLIVLIHTVCFFILFLSLAL